MAVLSPIVDPMPIIRAVVRAEIAAERLKVERDKSRRL